MRTVFWLVMSMVLLGLTAPVRAQSGIQWSGSAKMSVDRAEEMGVPVMFWVTDGSSWNDDDLKDAQRDAFRDPVVLEITERYFVPCRVSRNSNVIKEAERLGLPTNFGLYIAIITPDGKLLDQIDPGQVASPEALAGRLAAASRAYREAMYNEKIKPVLTDPKAAKSTVAEAVRTVWRTRMYGADKDVVALLARTDLTPGEKSRLYQLLAAFGTEPCVNALLDAALKDRAAAQALARAEPEALGTLLTSLPPESGDVSARQVAAYRAAAAMVQLQVPKSDTFWTSAKPEERAKELERLRTAGQAVFDSWWEREGHWR
jgi:hypothetical protein